MSEWEDCPFCGGKGPFTKSANHRLGCPHGDLIDESARLHEACKAALDWINDDRPWPRLAIIRDGLRDAIAKSAAALAQEALMLAEMAREEKP